MTKISWSDIIFWLALLVLLIWIILKSLGFINSPAVVELIPYLSGIFIAGAIWWQFRNMQSDLHQIQKMGNFLSHKLLKKIKSL